MTPANTNRPPSKPTLRDAAHAFLNNPIACIGFVAAMVAIMVVVSRATGF